MSYILNYVTLDKKGWFAAGIPVCIHIFKVRYKQYMCYDVYTF